MTVASLAGSPCHRNLHKLLSGARTVLGVCHMGMDTAQPEQYTSNQPSKRGRGYRIEEFHGTTLDKYLRCSL